MIFHSPYTITLEKTSLYFETLDPAYLCIFNTFGLINRGGEKKFIEQFNKLFGADGLDALSDDKQMEMLIFNRAYNLLPAMHEGLRIGLQVKNQKKVRKSLKYLFEMYHEEFGKKFKSFDDLKRIKTEINRLKSKLKNFKIQDAKPQKFDFEEVVVNTELLLGQQIDRSLKLFQFKKYFDRAAKIALEQKRK